MEPEYVLVVTTFPSSDQADEAATVLIERHLAACAQVVGPISSTYRWQGKIETSREWSCTFKTRSDRYDDLEAALLKLHPYDVPEILCFPIDGGYAGYLRWIDGSLGGSA